MSKYIERVCLPASGSVLGQIINFAISMVDIESDDPSITSAPYGWAIWHAIAEGAIGFYDTDISAIRGWWVFAGAETKNRYGQPDIGIFRTDSDVRTQITHHIEYTKSDGMKLLRANPLRTPPYRQMLRDADRIEAALSLLDVNLRASKRTQILQVPKEQRNTLLEILKDQENGDFSVIARESLSVIGSLDVSVPFVGGDIHTLVNNLWADALRRWGGVTPPQYKAERTQSAEVSATVAESIDNIYVMIDTLNADAERLGVPVRFKYRGYGARFDYDTPAEPQEPPQNAEGGQGNE